MEWRLRKSVIIIKASRLLSRLRLPSERVDREIGTPINSLSSSGVSGSLAPQAEHDRHAGQRQPIVRSPDRSSIYRAESRGTKAAALHPVSSHGISDRTTRCAAPSCNYPVFYARTSAPSYPTSVYPRRYVPRLGDDDDDDSSERCP